MLQTLHNIITSNKVVLLEQFLYFYWLLLVALMEDDSDYENEEEDRVCKVSTQSTLTAKSSIYRGCKRSFHRKHDNSRATKETDFYSDFVKLGCGGDHNTAHRLIDDFNFQNDKVWHSSFTFSLICFLFQRMP